MLPTRVPYQDETELTTTKSMKTLLFVAILMTLTPRALCEERNVGVGEILVGSTYNIGPPDHYIPRTETIVVSSLTSNEAVIQRAGVYLGTLRKDVAMAITFGNSVLKVILRKVDMANATATIEIVRL